MRIRIDENTSRQRDRKGAVLLVAVGILALLSVFALSFASLVSLERSASRNYIDAVRARLVARAGLQRAIAELRQIARERAYDDPRILNKSNPKIGSAWIYREKYKNTSKYVSLRDSTDISFGVVHGTVAGQTPVFKVIRSGSKATQEFVYSGIAGASYTNGIDVYRLKVIDCASMIHVNGKDENALERMTRNLLQAHGVTGFAQIAKRVRDRRPGDGYRTKAEVGLVMRLSESGPTVTSDQWLKIRDDITCVAWKDSKVIVPPASVTTTGTVVGAGTGGKDRLELTERAPVNINTASLPVLTAVLAEIEASKPGSSSTVKFSYAEAFTLAKAIRSRRGSGEGSTTGGAGPFRSWFEFETWLDTASPIAANGPKCDLVRAMVNPNTNLVKFGAEGNHIFRWKSSSSSFLPTVQRDWDKSDLTKITTEFCFASMGFFEITSLGQIWNAGQVDGKNAILTDVVAEQSIQSIVKVYDVLRLTNQRDFEKDREYRDPKLFLPYFSGKGGTIKGLNDRLAGKAGAWPATVTQPEYSNLHRLPDGTAGTLTSGNTSFTIDPGYTPADFDGQVALNGLARIEPTDPDFLLGFARGEVEPLKTHYGLNDLQRYKEGKGQKVTGITESGVIKNSATQVLIKNQQTPNAAFSLINTGKTGVDLFRGSGIVNLGALFIKERKQHLVFDGNNIRQLRGTIHFWVKPVKKVKLQKREVYFSWVGDQRGNGAREAGFTIFKERAASGRVQIVTEFKGLKGPGSGTRRIIQDVEGLWKQGYWNHVQVAYGLDDSVSTPAWTAYMFINSRPAKAGVVISGADARTVTHAYSTGGGGVGAATSTGQRGNRWSWPLSFHDYYYCDLSDTNFSTSNHEKVVGRVEFENGGYSFRDAASGASGQAVVDFPKGAADQEVIISFEPGPDTPADTEAPSAQQATRDPETGQWNFTPTSDIINNGFVMIVTIKYTLTEKTKGICNDCRNCEDCSNALDKLPYSYLQNNPALHCFNRFPPSIFQCDDCAGCEACDVDGPVFIGAEPASNSNADVDNVKNYANAVMDNVYFLGYRIDNTKTNPETGNPIGVDEVPSERFFDRGVKQVNEGSASARGHKPGYKKQLVDLFGNNISLGTISWTGYPAFASTGPESSNLDSASLMPITITLQRWDFSQAGADSIDYVNPTLANQTNFNEGIRLPNGKFASSRSLVTSGTPKKDPDYGGEGLSLGGEKVKPQELLILSVGFAPLTVGKKPEQTPILDDVTLTYFTVPQTLYSEEGGEE